MKETRTPKERYESWLKAVEFCWSKQWRNLGGWIFVSPSGTAHDLSAADLNQLDRMEKENRFAVETKTELINKLSANLMSIS